MHANSGLAQPTRAGARAHHQDNLSPCLCPKCGHLGASAWVGRIWVQVTSTSEHYTISGATCWAPHLSQEAKWWAPETVGPQYRRQVGVIISFSQKRKLRLLERRDLPRNGHSASTESWQFWGRRGSDSKVLVQALTSQAD